MSKRTRQGFKQKTGTVRLVFQRGHCNCPIVQHMLAILSEKQVALSHPMEIFPCVINVNPLPSGIHTQTQAQRFVLIKAVHFVLDAFESPALSTTFLSWYCKQGFFCTFPDTSKTSKILGKSYSRKTCVEFLAQSLIEK